MNSLNSKKHSTNYIKFVKRTTRKRDYSSNISTPLTSQKERNSQRSERLEREAL